MKSWCESLEGGWPRVSSKVGELIGEWTNCRIGQIEEFLKCWNSNKRISKSHGSPLLFGYPFLFGGYLNICWSKSWGYPLCSGSSAICKFCNFSNAALYPFLKMQGHQQQGCLQRKCMWKKRMKGSDVIKFVNSSYPVEITRHCACLRCPFKLRNVQTDEWWNW